MGYQEEYGSDEIIIALLEVENALDSSAVEQLKVLSTALEGLDFVELVFNCLEPVLVASRLLFKL